ncbi:BON domain-containing protein [Sinorhizobium meliloti]|uniref:BON domain-containing protein n=1 Tax=Rhizobium meliloti TaxID=382 RepID=UPI001F1DFF4B|nr:BON domain-containing protein [Sinorhizobium meliloti]
MYTAGHRQTATKRLLWAGSRTGAQGLSRSDERIREDVSNRLSHNSSIDASEIQVGVQRAEVILSGRVDSRKLDAIMPKSMRRRFAAHGAQNRPMFRRANRGTEKQPSRAGNAFDRSQPPSTAIPAQRPLE